MGTKGFAQKKVLSLVLCVAMLLSVMVMGTGAAFTDQDEIQNAEAVDMTSALGIIDGYEDDSFRPSNNIERSEAAKMISAMMNGGRDSVQETNQSSYIDVLNSNDSWANKYIEYCTARGIVTGVGGDCFAPANNVTGTQMAKMLLVCLGYNSIKESYEDSNMWSVNVNTDAVAAGLYAGIETIDMSAPLSRDNAAQMIWNALQANTVVYLTDSTGAINIQDTTLLDKVYGANTTTGILTDISYNHDTGVYTYTIDANGIAFGSLEDDYQPDVETFTSSVDYTGLFAQNVKVLANGDDEALMIRTDKGGVVVEATIGDIGGINTHRNTITVDGQKYTLDNEPNDPDDLRNMTCYYNQYYNGADWDAYDQYAFVGIDQDGGGDIDVFVVYPFVVLRTETVLNDTFVAREIKGSDASLTVGPQEQDRGLIADVLFGGRNQDIDVAPLSAEIEYDDIALNGTVEENGYVMVVPAEFTAQDIDTFTVLNIQSGVATSLSSRDETITFDSTVYDGALVNVIVPISTISLQETYGFVEVNGYLFIVDGNNIGPVMGEYVVVTKTAAVPHGVDKLWETNILKTDGTTETVDVYEAIDANYKVAPEVGSLYTIDTDLNGNYRLISVDRGTYGTMFKDENTNFDIQQAYKDGATLNEDWWFNGGLLGMYDTNAAGGFFEDMRHWNDTTYQIEDDATIFVYNRLMDSYSVVTGADLENIPANEVTWAFTGANAKVYNGTPTVDLGYVAVNDNPDETLVYAYVNGNPDRTTNEDGNYVLVVDVVLANGETATLTTQPYAYENDPDLDRMYRALTESDDNIFQLIVEDSTLIDIKAYDPAVSVEVTAALHDGIIELGGTKYFVDADTEFVSLGNYDSIASIPQGANINIVPELDDNSQPTGYVLAVIA
ncbi:MAG: S-layer homology domain-containing protein [Evtepia sp.]|nr:S-layer homology domain-containing protein [Evtepia sp.]